MFIHPPYIYTTNYDEAIELVAANIRKSYTKVTNINHMVNAEHGANLIVKFHGDFSDPKEIVLTKRDYDARLALENPLDLKLRSLILGKSLLFIGYSFRDKNIHKILDKHANQYGLKNVPTSYIITNEKYVTDEYTQKLESKNVKIISIADNDELLKLMKNVNQSAFVQYLKREIKSFFTLRPSKILIKSELENLKNAWNNSLFADEKFSEVLSEVVSDKKIPQNIEDDFIDLLVKIIQSEGFLKSKAEIINLYQWISLSRKGYLRLATEMMDLTAYDELNRGTEMNLLFDVILVIELKFKRKYTVFLIYLYLWKCHDANKRLTFDHIERLLDNLKHLRYQEFYNEFEGMPKDMQIALIEHFIKQHPPVLRSRFNLPSIGFPSGSEFQEKFLKSFPKDLR